MYIKQRPKKKYYYSNINMKFCLSGRIQNQECSELMDAVFNAATNVVGNLLAKYPATQKVSCEGGEIQIIETDEASIDISNDQSDEFTSTTITKGDWHE